MNPCLTAVSSTLFIGPPMTKLRCVLNVSDGKMTSIQGTQLPIWLTEYIAAGAKSMMV